MTDGSHVRKRMRLRGQDGFTLIELLVVILIIGILAAIAIPSFLSQKAKAQDASAKEVARSSANAAETYATDHNGRYAGMSAKAIQEYEPAIQIAEGGKNAWLQEAKEEEEGAGFAVTATSPETGDTFTWTRKGSGEVVRTCKAAGANTQGCRSGTW